MSARHRHSAKAGRRRSRRLPGWTLPAPGETLGEATMLTLTATNTETEVSSAMTWTHDQLILSLGDRRRSGIRWRIHHDHDTASALDAYYEHSEERPDLDPNNDPGAEAQQRAWLAGHPDAVLVVAFALASIEVNT